VQLALIITTLVGADANAQPGVRRLDMRGRVLDVVFSPRPKAESYTRKLLLRFGDIPSQLTVVTFVGGATEVRRLELVDLDRRQLDELILRAVQRDSQVTPEQIAAKISVRESHASIPDRTPLAPLLRELERIRISPVLGSRVPLENSAEYELVYDLWQESVHYTVAGPFDGYPQDKLVKWMLRFRARADEWLKGAAR